MAAVVLDPLEQGVYASLKEIAGRHALTTYGDLFAPFGFGDKKFRSKWRKVLGDISNYTKGNYGRWISALVHNVDTGYPGKGFFQLDGIPPRLSRVGNRLSADQMRLVDDERNEVWRYDWAHAP